MLKLTEKQIKQKLAEGRNYKRLYFELKVKYDEVVLENKLLKQQLADQKAYFEAIIEAQNARTSELETMVFGRKPKGGKPVTVKSAKVTKSPRRPESYRRPLQPATTITDEQHHSIDVCRRCKHRLTNKDEAIRYEEDIVIATLCSDVPYTTVIKHTIERGWCSRCGQYSSAKDLRGQIVTIGPLVRSLVVYLAVQADQSYTQIIDLLWQLYRFKITSGEITNILDSSRKSYLPTYKMLEEAVRAGPVHMDETSYPIQSEQGAGYAHVMASAITGDVVYKLADSRGKGNSELLVGKNYQGVGITDRYGAYKHLFVTGHHQICWAHLARTARDLTRLECLSEEKLAHVIGYYQALSGIYSSIRDYQAEPYNQAVRQAQATTLLEQTKELCQPSPLDPKKLAKLKAGILEYQSSLFLCLTIDGIPADNNKAERSLRKLVIKRKKSFGVKTLKGARTMEVLHSICQSLYNKDKANFLPALHALASSEPNASV